jgi:cell division protein FtsW (lipid II flippase)
MNRLWQQLAIATNWPVLAAVAVLSSIGVCSIWADSRADGQKQLLFLAIGMACCFLFQAVNYQKIGRLAWPFYIASLALVLYTVVPFTHVGQGSSSLFRVPYRGGAYAWINLGPMSLQPAELVKIAFILVLARYLRFRSNYRTIAGLLQPFALAVVPILMILKQPDLGTAITFIPILFAMLFVAGARMWHLLAVVFMGLALIPLAWAAGTDRYGVPHSDIPGFRYLPELVRDYQRDRVRAMFTQDPKTLREKGFQQERSLIAFGSGGITGKGAGVIPVGQNVPEGHNDMVFALIGEQFGLFGAAVVLGAYVVLFAAGLEIASSTREPFGRLVAPGLVALLAGQAFMNLMVCLRLMPVTGITLPFVSYGGSSLVASFMAAGLLLNIGQNRPLVMANDAFEYEE